MKSFVQQLLRWAARRYLAALHPFVIGVTGSAGKTSTKEAIGHVLRKTVHDREIRVSSGNLNTEFGMPLAILGLAKPEGKVAWAATVLRAIGRGLVPQASRQPVVYVLEYGVQAPGDMKQLLSISVPNVACVTNIGVVHFGSRQATAREKGQLVRALPATGIAVLNEHDDLVASMARLTQAETVFVSGTPRELSGAMAAAVAQHAFGVTKALAQSALKDWSPPTGRLNLLKGIKGSWVLDDSYNANPQSATLALAELRRLGKAKKAGRMIAVLGDMLELGPQENKDHTGIALLAQKAADHVVLVGPRFRRTKQGNEWFPGPVPAAKYLKSFVQKGDLVLVKGSQGMRMEKVSEVLLDKSLDPKTVLVRQSVYWKQRPYVAP